MIRIGTRGSLLALKQAHEVADKLRLEYGAGCQEIEIVEIRTSGDQIQDRPLSEVGGKGLFTKEIEQALLDERIDVAVHSLKDVETALPDGTAFAAILEREDVREVFISRKYRSVREMPAGSRLGTSSLRRRAQAININPGIELVDFRGNVQTRLEKLESGIADATFLARAGLNRLEYDAEIFYDVSVDDMLPAVAQGAIALQIRTEEADLWTTLAPLNDQATALSVTAERAFLARLDGSCRTPIAGLAEWSQEGIRFRGEILSIDGRRRLSAERRGRPELAVQLAIEAADELLADAGEDFF